MVDFQIKIISLTMNAQACESECNKFNGHLPYTFEGQGKLIIIDFSVKRIAMKYSLSN